MLFSVADGWISLRVWECILSIKQNQTEHSSEVAALCIEYNQVVFGRLSSTEVSLLMSTNVNLQLGILHRPRPFLILIPTDSVCGRCLKDKVTLSRRW